MYNLLLHTSDDHFLKLAAEYQNKCKQGVTKGTCGVCGVTGLGDKLKLSLKSLRYLILRGDQYDDSKYGKFKRDLLVATNPKDVAIAKLRLETLHTYTHPDGTVYHLFEGGIINNTDCRVCSTCNKSVSLLVVVVEDKHGRFVTMIITFLFDMMNVSSHPKCSVRS
jgi:hypothetical protein